MSLKYAIIRVEAEAECRPEPYLRIYQVRNTDEPIFTDNVDKNGRLLKQESTASIIADKINTELLKRMASGEIDNSEAAGEFALSSLLAQVSGGLLESKEEFIFLKGLAEKKTQNPIQRVEQTTKVDLKVSLADAIQDNPGALQSSLEKARKHNEEVLKRLGGDLMLDGNTKEEIAFANPGEPNEMRDIRNGGDGSVKILSFRDRLQNRGEEINDRRT